MTIPNADEDVKALQLSNRNDENVKFTATLQNNLAVFRKVKSILGNPAPLQSIYPRQMKTYKSCPLKVMTV